MDFTYDGDPLTTVRTESVELVEAADHGRIGAGSFTIDDVAGTLRIVGHKGITGTEPYVGYVGAKKYRRGPNHTGGGREIGTALLDLNARLGFRFIHGTGSHRPVESIGDRVGWLLADDSLSGLVADLGFVDYPDTMLDEADYRGRFPEDVLTDMSLVVGFNFFPYWDPDEEACGLWFRDSNASTSFSSSLRISTVLSDIDYVTTFPASGEAELDQDPSEVISQLWMPFERGNVIRTRLATEDTYPRRGGVAPSADVKRRARARAIADRYLRARSTEEDTITDAIEIPADKIGDVRAGQRIQARYQWLGPEGYDEFTWFRILETRKKPIAEDLYRVGLTLSPQEQLCDAISIVQSAHGSGSTGVILPNPVVPGNVLVALVAARMSTQITALQIYGDGDDTEWTWDYQDLSPATYISGGGPVGSTERLSFMAGVKVATTTNNRWVCGEAVTTSNADRLYVYELSSCANLGSREIVTLSESGWGAHDPGAFASTAAGDVLLYFIGKANLHGGQAYPVPSGSWTPDLQMSIGSADMFGIPPYCEWLENAGTGSAMPTDWYEAPNGYEDPWYIACAYRFTI